MKIKTVAVYSTADADSLPVQWADELVCIGPPAPKDSYLQSLNIISAAHIMGADAIHPGIGFLSEKIKLRGSVPVARPEVYRPLGRRYGEDGRQGHRARDDARCRRARGSGHQRAAGK